MPEIGRIRPREDAQIVNDGVTKLEDGGHDLHPEALIVWRLVRAGEDVEAAAPLEGISEDLAKPRVDLLHVEPGSRLAQRSAQGASPEVGAGDGSLQRELVEPTVEDEVRHVIDANRRRFLQKTLEGTDGVEERHGAEPPHVPVERGRVVIHSRDVAIHVANEVPRVC